MSDHFGTLCIKGLNTVGNINEDWLYSSTETTDELYKKKITFVGTITPSRKDLQIVVKTAKGPQFLSSEFIVKQWSWSDAILSETKQKCFVNVSCTQWITSLTLIVARDGG